MREEIVELKEDQSSSPLFSEDFAPVPASKRSWSVMNIAAIWVGMAVCSPYHSDHLPDQCKAGILNATMSI